MIGKRAEMGIAVTTAVLLGLCLSTGIATAAPDGPPDIPNPMGGAELNQQTNSTATDNSTLGKSSGISTADTGDVPTKVVDENYSGLGDVVITEIIPTDDGNYLLVGGGKIDDDSYRDGMVKKVTSSGSIIWERHYSNGQKNQSFLGGIQTELGNFVLAGQTETSDTRTVLGFKIDQDGTKLWEIEGGNSEGALYDVEETDSGRYLFAGDYRSSEGDNNAAVIKTTSDGDVIWNRYFWGNSERNEQEFRAIEQIESDRFVLAGTEYIQHGNHENWDAYSHEINAGGDTLTADTYGSDDYNDWFFDVVVTEGDDPVYVGMRDGIFDSDTGEYNFQDAWVYRDSESNDEWSDTIAVNNINQFRAVSIDENQIVAGGVSAASIGGQTDALTVEYDLDGNQNWQLTTEEGDTRIYDVLGAGDETYIVGDKSQTVGGTSIGSLIKYTSDPDQNEDDTGSDDGEDEGSTDPIKQTEVSLDGSIITVSTGGVNSIAVTELPSDVSVSAISDGGSYKTEEGSVLWTDYGDGLPETVTFTLTPDESYAVGDPISFNADSTSVTLNVVETKLPSELDGEISSAQYSAVAGSDNELNALDLSDAVNGWSQSGAVNGVDIGATELSVLVNYWANN